MAVSMAWWPMPTTSDFQSLIRIFVSFSLPFLSVLAAIYGLVHRKKSMRAVFAVVMDRHAHNQCTNGIWHRCPCARLLAAAVSSTHHIFAFVSFRLCFPINFRVTFLFIFTNIRDSFSFVAKLLG